MLTTPSTANGNQGKWSYYQISEARKQLQTYYSDQQNQQMTRLIGFVIGLFTLLQLTQSSKSSPLSSVFPYFPSVIEATYAPFWDFLKVVFLFFGVSLILFFILRTIFRYALYGNMACWVMNINYGDIMKNKDKWSGCNEMFAFNYSLSLEIYRTARTTARIFGIVPANWFFHFVDKDKKDTEHPSHEKCGHVFCIFISALTSLLLLLFLW